MACRSVTVRLSSVGFGLVVVMSSLTASKKVLRALSLSLGGFPSTLVMEWSVVFVGCAIIAVLGEKVLG